MSAKNRKNFLSIELMQYVKSEKQTKKQSFIDFCKIKIEKSLER